MKAITTQCLWIALSLLSISIYAQNITGTVSTEDGAPLAYASVLLLQPSDSSLVAGNITDENGSYQLQNVPPNSYLIAISMIGYLDTYTETFTTNGKTFNAPSIILMENDAQLEEVVVVEKRALFEQKIDRMVVNVDNSITSAGNNVLEILQRSPGVTINPQSNDISMSGKTGVVVMINGKISRMPADALVHFLRGMSADNIDKIELIHTPPSNFDAEGNAGFINIVLKKNQNNGFNGGFSLNAGYGQKEKAGASFNFNLRKNRVNFFGDYSWNYTNSPQVFKNYRSFVLDGVTTEQFGDSDRDPTKTHVHNAHLGLDLQLSKNTVIGGLVSWMDRDWTMYALNDVRIVENGNLISQIKIPNEEINHSYNVLGNINLEHQFTGDQKLNIDLDYGYFYKNNPSSYTNQYFDANEKLVDETKLRVANTTPMNIWVGKVDYTKNFTENIILELGTKGTSTTFDNTVLVEDLIQDVWVKAPFFSSEAMMTERIAAAYGAVNWKVNDQTEIKGGLRYEYTDSNLGTVDEPDIVDRQFGRLFPSLFISNKINETNTVQFSYSRRIQRPSFRDLAPWFIFFDPNSIGTGNPLLQPAISDAIRGTYIWKTVQLGVQYAYTKNHIARHQPTVDPETNTQINGTKNFEDSKLASATLSFPIKITEWWSFRSSWTAQWSIFNDRVDNQIISFEQSSWNMNASTSFKLPKKFNLEVSTVYFSPELSGSVVWQDFYSLDFGIQKEFNNDNGTLSFSVNDILQSATWTGRLDDPEVDFKYEGFFDFTERVFRLTYSRSFGNNKLKSARKRTTGSAEEQRRAN